MRLRVDQLDDVSAWRTAGAQFISLQPVYEPARFRTAMATLAAYDDPLPVVAEALVLPDAQTADEIDNEVPALSVPERLRRRLAEDPNDDIRGVLRFLSHWRHKLAGVCLICPDERTQAQVAVVEALAQQAARS